MRAGALQKLDQGKLEHLDDIEPGLRTLQARYPHSRHATVPYTWGTIGLTWNQAMIDKRLNNAPVNSLDMIFKPEIAAKFADCGISMIDSPDEVLAVVLNYLGHDPRSSKPDELAEAVALLKGIAVHSQVPVAAGDPVGQRRYLPVPRLQRRHDPGPAYRRRGRQGDAL